MTAAVERTWTCDPMAYDPTRPAHSGTDDYDEDRDDEIVFYERSEARRSTSTSELYLYLVTTVALLFFTYEDGGDSLSREDGWRYAAVLTAAYLISRGLAKAGSSEPRLRRRSIHD